MWLSLWIEVETQIRMKLSASKVHLNSKFRERDWLESESGKVAHEGAKVGQTGDSMTAKREWAKVKWGFDVNLKV